MARRFLKHPALWLAAGLLVGWLGKGFWNPAPSLLLNAVATDRYENFAIATGPLDNDVEAVYFLDFLTGNLRAAVLSPQLARFNAFFEKNVISDMGIDPSQNPRYLMVTGIANLRRMGGVQARPSASVVYIAELTSGKVAAYALPWRPDMHNAGAPIKGSFIPLDIAQFRTEVVRQQE